MRQPVLSLLIAVALAAPAVAEVHVRVVLDTSRSMQANDPGRLATLSTLLLYDLAQTNSTLGDSFEVIPFDPAQKWASTSDPPPTGTGTRIRADFSDRSAFAGSLAALRYAAAWTYYYPGLLEAIGDLEATPGGGSDVRVLVLVTDGLPEKDTRDEEARRIREDLLPRLQASGIRLYVLGFGPQSFPNRGFFDALVQGPGGATLGEVFVDPDGSRLIESMIQIFTRSFGYTQEPPQTLPVGSVDLAGGQTPARVAAVLFWKKPQPPQLLLTTPKGGVVNAPGGVLKGQETGASYEMQWVLSPRPGAYPVEPKAVGATLAVLRPSPLQLEVRSPRPGGQVRQVMASQEVDLEVLVKPAAGAKGDPGEVDLSYQTHGDWTGSKFTWDGEALAPPAADRGRAVPEGRIYSIYPRFPEPRPGERFYVSHLEVTARRGARIAASLLGSQAHRLEVYPRVAIEPRPMRGDAVPEGAASVRALGRWERGCTRFRLALVVGRLPEPASLRAALPASTAVAGGLAGASWTLDGHPLEVDGRPGPSSSPWTVGRPLKEKELLGEHEVCIQVGKPTSGDPSKPYELPVELTLLTNPYDGFDVIEPFRLKVLIAPPTLLERWGARGAVLGTLLGLVLTLWFLRGRPDLPDDLCMAIGHAGSGAGLPRAELGEPSLTSRLLGLVGDRTVVSGAGGTRLGAVRPVREGLYRFRPARGVRVETLDSRPVAESGGVAELSVHRVYRLKSNEGEFLFQMEYR
jgi:hypothetical protein